jgi:hypothetical protein
MLASKLARPLQLLLNVVPGHAGFGWTIVVATIVMVRTSVRGDRTLTASGRGGVGAWE